MRAGQAQGDPELLTALAGGDLAAMRTLYDRHAPWLSARLTRRCNNPDAVAWAGRAEPGEIAATVVGGTMLALIVFDLPSWWPVPLFPGDAGWPASTALWSGLGVASAVVVVLASADPYRPSRPVGMRSAHVPWLAWSGGDPEPDGDGRSSPGSSPRWWVCRR
jgi:hypothetical protein